MKIQIRTKVFNHVFYFLIAGVERVEDITSDIKKSDNHILLWDFDDSSIEGVEKALTGVKGHYNLGDIYIMSDKIGSYRAMCFTTLSFKDMLKVLLDTDGIDMQFFNYTVKREYATIRISTKLGRRDNDIVKVVGDNEYWIGIDQVTNKEFLKYIRYEADKDGKKIQWGKFD